MANHPLQNMITRAVITAIDTVRKCQTAGLKLIAGEKRKMWSILNLTVSPLQHRMAQKRWYCFPPVTVRTEWLWLWLTAASD